MPQVGLAEWLAARPRALQIVREGCEAGMSGATILERLRKRFPKYPYKERTLLNLYIREHLSGVAAKGRRNRLRAQLRAKAERKETRKETISERVAARRAAVAARRAKEAEERKRKVVAWRLKRAQAKIERRARIAAERAANREKREAEKAERLAAKAKAAPRTFYREARDVARLEKYRNFVITCAVNNSAAHPNFVSALEHYASDHEAAIVMPSIRYRNPHTREDVTRARYGWHKQDPEWWDPRIEKYLLDGELRPHDRLSLMCMKVQATASNPLPPRLSGLTQNRSAVFGHPQLAMRTVPTPQHKLPKTLYTSGACTEKQYSDTLAGALADFHHSLAAIVVEIRDHGFHLREITWNEKGQEFIDLGERYTARGRSKALPPEALVMGDIHVGAHDPLVMHATFGEGSIYEALRPKRLVLHDLFDGLSINHHEAGKVLTAASRATSGKSNLRRELDENARWLNALPPDADVYIVESNHNEFLMRWLQHGKPEPENALVYHKLAAALLEAGERGEAFPNPLELWLRPMLERSDAIRFLKTDEIFRIGGVELGMHGHRGPNGARGSVRNLSQIGTRSIIGHVHSPEIWQGVYAVGLSGLYDQGYNAGPSSWLQTHALVHSNGFRQLVHLINGHWRG